MGKLTNKEEEIMNLFWEKGPMFVRELLEIFPEPKPHFNTLSTIVRSLESKGYVGHTSFGSTHQYFAKVDKSQFNKMTLKDVVKKYFSNSYMSAVSALVEEDNISVDELRELLDQIQAKKEK